METLEVVTMNEIFKTRVKDIVDKYPNEEIKTIAISKLETVIDTPTEKPSSYAGALIYIVGKKKYKLYQKSVCLWLKQNGYTTSEVTIRTAVRKNFIKKDFSTV